MAVVNHGVACLIEGFLSRERGQDGRAPGRQSIRPTTVIPNRRNDAGSPVN